MSKSIVLYGAQGTDEWASVRRKLVVTASRIGRCIDPSTAQFEMHCALTGARPAFNAFSRRIMDYGTSNETYVAQRLEGITRMKLVSMGLMQNTECDWFGASPDMGIVSDYETDGVTGTFECPVDAATSDPEPYDPDKHVLKGVIEIKTYQVRKVTDDIPRDHVLQMLGEMYACNVDRALYVVSCGGKLIIREVRMDHELWASTMAYMAAYKHRLDRARATGESLFPPLPVADVPECLLCA